MISNKIYPANGLNIDLFNNICGDDDQSIYS